MAISPANTPGPMILTSSKAQISELIERLETMISRAMGRMNRADGVVLRAARKATGIAINSAITVPRVAMFSVSHNGSHSLLI